MIEENSLEDESLISSNELGLEDKQKNPYAYYLLLVNILLPSLLVVVTKAMFAEKSVGSSGESEYFSDPVFLVLMSSLGAAVLFLIPLFNIPVCGYKIVGVELKYDDDKIVYFLIFLSSTSLISYYIFLTISLVYIPASYYIVIVSFSFMFLVFIRYFYHRNIMEYTQWVACGLMFVGLIILVTVAVIFVNIESASSTIHTSSLIPVICVFLASLMAALEVLIDEVLIKEYNIPQFILMGSNGCIGVVLVLCILYPIGYLTTSLNFINSIKLVSNSIPLQLLSVSIVFVNSLWWITYVAIIDELDGLWCQLSEFLSALFAWMLSLSLFYFLGAPNGESWKNYSFLELIGYLFILVGIYVYHSSSTSINECPIPALL